jgi:hypothetical protein
MAECFKNEEVLTTWMSITVQILELPVPPKIADFTENSDEIQERDKRPFWEL